MFVLEGDQYDRTVCLIEARVRHEGHLRAAGPTFIVKFSDGNRRVASHDCLNPWFPT